MVSGQSVCWSQESEARSQHTAYWPVTSRQHADSKRSMKLLVTDYSIRPRRWQCCLLPTAFWPVTSRQHADSKRSMKLLVTDYSIRPRRWQCCLLPTAYCSMNYADPLIRAAPFQPVGTGLQVSLQLAIVFVKSILSTQHRTNWLREKVGNRSCRGEEIFWEGVGVGRGDFAVRGIWPQPLSTFNRTQSPGARSYFQNHQPLQARLQTALPAADGDL